jgi:formate dehydrogenase beta subunit
VVHLFINDTEIAVPEGTTILEAARSNGIYIPTVCSHPDLPSFRNMELSELIFQGTQKIVNDSDATTDIVKGCEICIVQQEGLEEPVRSCDTEVTEGMNIYTETPQVKKKRQQNLIRILENHPHACLTCSQREGCIPLTDVCPSNVPLEERCCSLLGNCELQRVVEYIGIAPETSRYRFENKPKITDEPLFIRDLNLCINCGRCVRVCRTVRAVGALGTVIHNGTLAVGTVDSPSLDKADCRFCGFCVEVCPTGAFTDKDLTGDRESALIPCRFSCPAGIDVPRYLRCIADGKFSEAAAVIREKVPFPGVLGHVCFHPCEEVCRRGEVNEPISICSLKRSAFEKDDGHWKQYLKTAPPTGKSVAIVGSGPAGLTAAYYLARNGHHVTIFEAQPEPGGMLRYGIPAYRLPKEVLKKEIDEIRALGVEIKNDTRIGRDISYHDIQSDGCPALFVSAGTQLSKRIDLEGKELNNVRWGVDFLREVNSDIKPKVSEKVLVIGGGNVALDVAFSALRLGAEDVKLVCLESREEMPAYRWEIERALEEHIEINNSWGPKRMIGRDGSVAGIELIRCTRVFDNTGEFNPILDDSERKILETDMVILAIGQTSDLSFLENRDDIRTHPDGRIRVNEETLETGIPGVFAGGDIVTGPKSVIEAIEHGRRAAESIDRYLGGDGDISEAFATEEEISLATCKEQGFAEKNRYEGSCLPISQRIADFSMVELGFDEETAILEAKRCLQCDLRLRLQHVPMPPEKWIPLDADTITEVPDKEGVFQLFDEQKKVIFISGTDNVSQALQEQLETNDKARFFLYELDPMFTKRETELIQQHMQIHGEMPEGNLDLDDLF